MVEIIAAGWICVRERRLLVVRTDGADAFYVPGGKPEPGESYAEAAAREVEEETGIGLDAAELTLFTEIVAPAHGRHAGKDVRLICFLGLSDQEPKASNEIAELDWFTSVDADRCAPAIQLLIAELRTADLID